MTPWRDVPWSAEKTTQKLTIDLRGRALHRVRDVYRSAFLPPPKAILMSPIYGLEQHVKATMPPEEVKDIPVEKRSFTQILLPLEPEPRVVMRCSYSADPKWTGIGTCLSFSSNQWDLDVTYRFDRASLPEWRTVHAKVMTFVDSLEVTP
jgi:hypothetical protein